MMSPLRPHLCQQHTLNLWRTLKSKFRDDPIKPLRNYAVSPVGTSSRVSLNCGQRTPCLDRRQAGILSGPTQGKRSLDHRRET